MWDVPRPWPLSQSGCVRSGYETKHHSSLVPRPLAHSGFVGGPEYEAKLADGFTKPVRQRHLPLHTCGVQLVAAQA